ncbi:MAG: zf-HC2 domain-containing protein [Armatimonadota bacterium]
MECEGIREKLGFYLDGTLDEHNLELVEAHLAGCDECRRELAAMKKLIDTAGQAEMLEPPLGLRERILRAVADEERNAQPLTKISDRLSLIDRLKSCASPAGLRWAAGVALAGCAALAILIGAPHEPVKMQAARQIPRPAQAIAEKTQPQPKSTTIAESQSSEPAQVRLTGKQVRHYTKRHTIKHSIIVAARPAKSPTSHTGNARVIAQDHKHEIDADAQETDAMATQTAAAAETAANAEPVNEQPVVIKVAAAPVFNNEKIHEWMQQAKMQAEMRKNRDSRAVINIVSARF